MQKQRMTPRQSIDNARPDNGGPILLMEGLHKDYLLGKVAIPALNNIDLGIGRGEYVAIVGPSGSGKSTLLNIIGCLDRHSSGRYYLCGKDVSLLDDNQLSLVRGALIGFVFQSFNLISQLNVVENIEVPMYYQGVSEKQSSERARQLADLVGLGNRLNHRPAELSGGQQQRVAIARAMANDPVIILADEPTGNLDSRSGADVLEIIVRLHQRGKTIITVTHDERVACYSQRTVNVFDGKISGG